MRLHADGALSASYLTSKLDFKQYAPVTFKKYIKEVTAAFPYVKLHCLPNMCACLNGDVA